MTAKTYQLYMLDIYEGDIEVRLQGVFDKKDAAFEARKQEINKQLQTYLELDFLEEDIEQDSDSLFISDNPPIFSMWKIIEVDEDSKGKRNIELFSFDC